MPNREPQHGTDVLTQSKQKLQKPPLYKVLLHNDNYTTMEFVVHVLMNVFHHSENDAIRIMLQVHNEHVGVAGVYTYEIAETKIAKVTQLAREYDYPLLCSLEEE
ncbi:MAG TPA: ATP-dependent Clp protease adaptor ClpS [Blastocatellia bacterium]|nr:ATP-dependent Clp protease adaptor ClpS [Blastocatellia bacterium]HMV87055.1 ATP-dependent Clp protease adaptor ClpS [Blastocatellia bacterium]HMX30433.1 ATP-dependent Clp protease adaptor ClpS [Blastocatellia bacterium]HMY76108.1 ATP-dependent Clp protease adaptor ClpS [Blastocatellia bacterium]HMZ19162.1 ATP-dependent Clp protease adaptor ClpS [Blastocatellia bacterium]